ncbi:D-alanyl-D-alanine endopeptidase precursor [Acidithrix ferrooxidans]|uniref:D-alanyl-D-alanine endopeptidase n=2 Tax=root TaxID=1 RepID=A0A0D8HMC5_9ACTN|nr:D-alanyl-D-alanine endopeptidase precursor [Acidithrix ferrooxidans]
MGRNDSWVPRAKTSGGGYGYYRRDRARGAKRLLIGLLVILVLVGALGAFQLLRTPPQPKLTTSISSSQAIAGPAPTLTWPSQGAADVGLEGVGSVGNHGTKTPIGLASVAKIITALVIIHDHPLAVGAQGPNLTVTPGDVSNYQSMLAAQDSVMAVVSGEVLTEYQALEALLIPSADNVASLLAQWDAGSISAFTQKMNQMAASLGMKNSKYVDPSGLDSNTAGTAPDQLRAAQALLANPVLAQIVAMPQATLPVAGVVYNVNGLVGHDNITGVKTGSTPAGGNFVFSGTTTLPANPALPRSVSSNPQVIGVILGQQGYTPLPTALSAGKALLDSFRKIPKNIKVINQGAIVGSISAPGQSAVSVVTAASISLVGWPGLTVRYRVQTLKNLPSSFGSGFKVGTLTATIGSESASVNLIVNGSVKAPTIAWRLRRL